SPVRVLQPGLRALPANTERYLVRGGGSLAITLNPGDELEVVSPEGLQAGEVCVFNQHGKSDMQTIGARASGTAEGLKQILLDKNINMQKLHAALKSFEVDLAQAQSTLFFTDQSPAGDSISFTANELAYCLIAVPGADMLVDEQTTTTDLVTYVHRYNSAQEPSPILLPDPLADPLQDIRI
ncbi:MAG: aminomethyltransferase, partial [Gammaproteobacteria bacterium]|nr:aminomethyltransferase [Gammaproteobacteria bacterium]